MQRTSFAELDCSIAQCLEAVGDRWAILILRDVFLGTRRFDQIQAGLGIARNVLTDRLAHLVEQGVLDKVAYQMHPPRYDYRLSDKGRDLWLVLAAMREWGDRWTMPDGPPVEVTHRACGHATRVVTTCAECGGVVGPREVEATIRRAGRR